MTAYCCLLLFFNIIMFNIIFSALALNLGNTYFLIAKAKNAGYTILYTYAIKN